MKSLSFWYVPLSLVDSLIVTDSKGTLYYLSLGKWASLVDLVKKDFVVVAKEYILIPGKSEMENADILKTKELVAAALESPKEIDLIRRSLRYEYIFGTPLQRQVWDYLVLNVPVGTTTTYSVIAKAVKKAGSARVIGNACGSNRIALFVPCHRVLTSSHTITGYRYGLAIKKVLLQKERPV